PSVKPILRRRSGVRKIRAMALNKKVPPRNFRRVHEHTVHQTNGKGPGACRSRAYPDDSLYANPYLTEPPAASILVWAEAETLSTETLKATVMSPSPRTFTSWFLRTRPFATRISAVMSPPSGKTSASLARFTTWYSVRKGFLKPRSFGARMCSGIWPPSKPTRTVLRARVPFVPRPAVLPFEPSPRPLRVFAVLAPGTGRRC